MSRINSSKPPRLENEHVMAAFADLATAHQALQGPVATEEERTQHLQRFHTSALIVISDLSSEIGAMRGIMNTDEETIQGLERSLTNAQNQSMRYQESLVETRDTIQALKDDVSTKDETICAANSSAAAASTRETQHLATITDLRDKVYKLLTDHGRTETDLRTELRAATNRAANLNNRVDDLFALVDRANDHAAAMRSERDVRVAAANDRADGLSARLAEVVAEVALERACRTPLPPDDDDYDLTSSIPDLCAVM
ncbi:hypothetical protein SLS58_002900 [Diplodia intermedia]|uniref:Uncharacterized protein n=1 Tax=Diplodia intermedia TaxID=856260 RepID=A0ABR3TYP7_9PEZI